MRFYRKSGRWHGTCFSFSHSVGNFIILAQIFHHPVDKPGFAACYVGAIFLSRCPATKRSEKLWLFHCHLFPFTIHSPSLTHREANKFRHDSRVFKQSSPRGRCESVLGRFGAELEVARMNRIGSWDLMRTHSEYSTFFKIHGTHLFYSFFMKFSHEQICFQAVVRVAVGSFDGGDEWKFRQVLTVLTSFRVDGRHHLRHLGVLLMGPSQ